MCGTCTRVSPQVPRVVLVLKSVLFLEEEPNLRLFVSLCWLLGWLMSFTLRSMHHRWSHKGRFFWVIFIRGAVFLHVVLLLQFTICSPVWEDPAGLEASSTISFIIIVSGLKTKGSSGTFQICVMIVVNCWCRSPVRVTAPCSSQLCAGLAFLIPEQQVSDPVGITRSFTPYFLVVNKTFWPISNYPLMCQPQTGGKVTWTQKERKLLQLPAVCGCKYLKIQTITVFVRVLVINVFDLETAVSCLLFTFWGWVWLISSDGPKKEAY